MKKLFMVVTILAILTLPASVYALISVEGAVGAWGAAPSGDFSYKALSGSNTDFEDTFGFDDEIFPNARLKLELPVIPNIYLMATPMKFEGTADKDFTFDGETFTADADTELTFNQYDLALYYGVPFLGLATLGKVHVNVGLNLRAIDMEAKMYDDSLSLSKSESVTIPVPMLYLAADVSPIDLLTFEAELRALPVSDYEVMSAIGRVKINLPGPVFVAAGYRYETMAVDHDDFDFELDIAGPFAEAGFNF